jgi:hypothetical protein
LAAAGAGAAGVQLWKREGYDLHMSIYGVVSTAFNEGFIEVVSNASTCSKIQKVLLPTTAARWWWWWSGLRLALTVRWWLVV